MRVSIFITCFNDTLFPQTGRAMVELLERLGHEVEFRPEQTCCGQMHMNSGYRDEGIELAARMQRVFDGAEVIVTPSASCAGHVLEHAPGLPVHELSQFLTGVLGLDMVEIDDAEQCCGFGGTFAVKNAEVSMAMLEDKLSAIERSGAEAVTAVDNSGLMQIGGGLSRRGSPVRAVHLAEILAAT